MALFKISKGLKSNLPANYTEGYCYFTTDDGKFYIDTNNAASGRVCLNAEQADTVPHALISGGTTATNNLGKTWGATGVSSGNRIYSKCCANLNNGQTTLKNGLIIAIKLPVAGNSSGYCISINNGNEYHPMVYNNNSIVTTHFNVNQMLLLMYDGDTSASVYGSSAGVAATSAANITGVWRVMNTYLDGNTVDQLRYSNTRVIAGTNGIYGYNLIALDNNNKWQGFVKSRSTSTIKTINTEAKFKLPINILYYGAGNDATNGNAVPNTYALYIAYPSIDLRYSHNYTTNFTVNTPVYLEGTIDNNGYFSVTSKCITQTLTSGNYYIFLGTSSNSTAYQLHLHTDHPVYYYNGTNLVDYTRKLYGNTLSVSGKTVALKNGLGETLSSITTQDTTYSGAGSSLGLVKTGGDVTISNGVITVNDDSHNHTIANVDNLQSTLDSKMNNAVSLTSNNLNSVTTPGFYYGGGSNTCTNKPSNVDAFGLEVFKTADGYTTQILTEGNTHAGARYIRQYNASTWSSWLPLAGFSATPTSGQVVIADGTFGKVKTSGYTIASSVPSGAKFTDTTYSNATTSTAGLMSKDDKIKLNGIAEGANKTTVDSALSSTSTNPVQNKVITAAVNTTTEFSNKIKRGINSIINSSDAISINPAVNGIGYSIARGATAFVRFDGFELPIIQKSMEKLFDGKSSTYIRLQQIADYVNVSEMAWNESTQYHSGDFVVLRKENTDKVIMFKALQDNVGVNPIDDSDVWLDNYRDSTGTYSSSVILKNITIQMEFRFPDVIDYENGFSLYFRSAGQVARNLVFETGLSDGSLWIVEKSINGNCNVVETIPTIGGIPNHRGKKKSIRLTFESMSPEATWTAFTQICVTGLVGGIEGTLLNRGGGTLYGTVTPEIDNAISLGSSTKRWNNVHSNVFTGNLSGNASTATKATQDSAGQRINTTYIKGLSISGTTITYTKGDGTKGTITTQDTNTDTKVTNTLATTTKAYITGTTSSSTNTGTQVFDTGVYLDTTAGQLTATTFKGSLSGNASTATKLTSSAGSSTQPVYFSDGKPVAITGTINNSTSGYAAQLSAYSTAGEYNKNSLAYFNASVAHNGTARARVNDSPFSSATWCHFLRFTHNNSSGHYTDLCIPFNANSIYYKRVGGGEVRDSSTNYGWVQVLDQLNYTNYAPTKTGSGASGTWGISISGNASTATKLATARTIALTGSVTGSGTFDGSGNLSIATTTNHNHDYLSGWSDTRNTTTTPNDYNSKLKVVGIKTPTGSGALDGSSYSTLVGIRGWTDSSGGNAHELAFTGSGSLYRRHGSTTSWNAWVKILDSGNYTDYTVKKDGTGASGTWGIGISGNAATATKLATARTISLTGSVTGSGSFDGSGNLSITTTTNHTHNYAGSSSAGGSATSAVKLDTATAGSTTQPVYFSGGKPVAITGNIANGTTGNAATATKATQDSAGQQINTTYIKSLSVSGATITYTKGNGSTGTITTQDLNARQTLTSSNTNYPLLMAQQANTVTTNNIDNITYRNNSIYANPSTGMIASTSSKIGEHVTLQYDSTNECLNFMFS